MRLAFVRHVLRGYSYVFEGILSLMAIGVGSLAALSSNAALHIGWLPFDDHRVTGWLLGLGIAGLLCVLLALLGRFRILLFLFALSIAVILIKGLFLGSYTYAAPGDAKNAAYMVAGSLLAVLGSIPQMVPGRSRR
ncbi:MAG TPA: hypothetical protein DEQ47_09665 [Solibacterales bacterium]|jgi:uncharacterized membrane protein|nr:hypothetical protein [Bryobacterales bacterium]